MGTVTMDDNCGRRLIIDGEATGTPESKEACQAFMRNSVPGNPDAESLIRINGRYIPLAEWALACEWVGIRVKEIRR